MNWSKKASKWKSWTSGPSVPSTSTPSWRASRKTGRLVIVEESFPVASIASEVSYRIQRHAFDYLDAPIRRICQSDTPFAFSTSLIEEALPQVADIVRTVKEVNYVA